jgi:hypothetical protein
MPDNSGNLGLADGADLAVQPLKEVETARPEFPSPTQIADAMFPVLVAGEWRDGVGCVTNETANRVGVEGEEERDEQMVRVPERLERLLPDTVMRRCVHQEHAQEHHVAGNTTRLNVVDLHRRDWPNLSLFDIVEAAYG